MAKKSTGSLYAKMKGRGSQNSEPAELRLGSELLADWEDTHPNLAEFVLTTNVDGQPIETGKLSIYLGRTEIDMCLNLRSEGLFAFVSGKNLTELMKRAEEGLAQDTLKWHQSKPMRGKTKK